MGKGSIIEKVFKSHSEGDVTPAAGDIVELSIDCRVARDFGGANVVKNLVENDLKIADKEKTYFTFDCNPGSSDQKYAANQMKCRSFARERDIKLYDIDMGIGTQIAIEDNLVKPGGIFVSTDSHANIMGSIGAFGQGMGDIDIAAAWAYGKVWFKMPKAAKLKLGGLPKDSATPKDVTLKLLSVLGANSLLGYAWYDQSSSDAEGNENLTPSHYSDVEGEYLDNLSLSGRITIASMATEMGAICLFFPPNEKILGELGLEAKPEHLIAADPDAEYEKVFEIDISDTVPNVSRPGHPEDVVAASEVAGQPIDSAFVGSCTNGRYEDIVALAKILKGKKISSQVVLKVVPATRKTWQRLLDDGWIKELYDSGALIGNAGCAGCAAGQIGQNGPGEVTISTGNRNFVGKQGKGFVYLASPATVARSALNGYIVAEGVEEVKRQTLVAGQEGTIGGKKEDNEDVGKIEKETKFVGKVHVLDKDNIDTDQIFHNKYLSITDVAEMGKYAFDNLPGHEDFAKIAKPGDIIITGKNFGCGSSRQQSVGCFQSLGVSIVIAESFGSIYERNGVNAGLPLMTLEGGAKKFETGDILEIDMLTGEISCPAKGIKVVGSKFSEMQMKIYQCGGLLRCTDNW